MVRFLAEHYHKHKKMVLRNLTNTLRSHKTASVLNVIGLATAFTIFYIIAAQIWYSVTYNSSIDDSERIYLVSPNWNTGEDGEYVWSENCPQPVTREAVEACPDAELYTWFRSFAWPDHIWTKNASDDLIRHNFGCYVMGTDGVEMFGFKTVAGDLNRLREPNTVIISETAADRLRCKVGDAIWINGEYHYENPDDYQMNTVIGIYEDFPRNTFLHDHHIFIDDQCVWGQENSGWNYSAFVRMKEGSDPAGFAEIWEKGFETWFLGMLEEWEREYGDTGYEEGEEKRHVKMISLDKMYYFSDFQNSYYETGSQNTTMTLTGIALLIIIIAFINFFNFYMALVPSRIRGVNINKVLGATQKQLRFRLIAEAILLTSLALCLALILISILKNSFASTYVTCSLAVKDNIGVLLVIGTLMVGIAAISSFFPAIYSTNANTSMAVKTGFAQSRSGRILRYVLVGLQFTISMALIIITAVFYMQYRYMTGFDIGFEKENMLTFSCRELGARCETTIGILKNHPDIEAVTATNSDIFSTFHNIWGREINGKNVQIEAFAVRWDFPEVMGIEFIDGDGFSGNVSEGYQIAFTRSTMPAVKDACSDGTFDEYKVKGTISDIRLTPVSRHDVLTCLYTHPLLQLSTFYIRTRPQADMNAVIDFINDKVEELAPGAADPCVTFVNEKIKAAYTQTLRQTTIIGIFALIAVMISLMGVFSIVMFETRHKESEISIRKVYGASVEDIIRMFNRKYIIIVSVCFLIASPVAYMVCGRWLEQFAHRISIPLWVFPASLALVVALTVAIVTARSVRAAHSNPSETLKKE